jgi:type IV pilus assembly protein PilW
MLVAIALGLLLVAAAAALLVAELAEQRRMLLETRLTQDLRAAADLAVHDLRRAGYWGDAATAVWQPGTDAALSINPYRVVYPSAGNRDSAVGYAYSIDTEDQLVTSNERFGLRLNAANHTLDVRRSGAAIAPGTGDRWEALTDPAQVRITRLQISSSEQTVSLLARCRIATCPSMATNCPPIIALRVLTLELDGQSSIDATMRRSLQTRVRLRNDRLSGACPEG